MFSPSVIRTEEELIAVVDYFMSQDGFSFDVEAQGENRSVPHLASLSWLSMSTKGLCVAIPFGHPNGDKEGLAKVPVQYKTGKKAGQFYNKTVKVYDSPPAQLDAETVFRILKPLFFKPGMLKGGHDVIYDLVSAAKYWHEVPPGPYFDTKIMRWLLDENQYHFGLKDGVEAKYGFRYDFENIGKCVENFPFSLVGYYSFCDSKYTWLEYIDLIQKIRCDNLERIYHLEMQLLSTMIDMRIRGARIDRKLIEELREELSRTLVTQEMSVYRAAGRKFTINSNPQKQQLLFVEQGLRPYKLTKGGKDKEKAGLPLTFRDYSVDDEVLSYYPENALAFSLREYGDTQKLLSTYVNSWLGDDDNPSLIYDDHIYAGFQQYGTVTGRFSCRAPNLQNLPRSSTERGKKVRDLFSPEPGGKLIVADYGQIELVVLAHYLGEGKLYEGFLAGIDPHTMTAAMILDKRPEDVLKTERQDMGKTMNFAIVYGAGINKVASMAHITPAEAKRKLAKHKEMFPEIHDFRDAVIGLARSRKPVPYITTLMGRKRRIPEINSSIDWLRMKAERQLFNSLIQGGAADLIKLAMVRTDSLLPDDAHLVLTIHDEIIISSPEEHAQLAADALKEGMTGSGIQSLVKVPLLADVKICDKWSEGK